MTREPEFGGYTLTTLRAWLDYAERHFRPTVAVPVATMQALIEAAARAPELERSLALTEAAAGMDADG